MRGESTYTISAPPGRRENGPFSRAELRKTWATSWGPTWNFGSTPDAAA